MKIQTLHVIFLCLFVSSCIVQSPKYTTFDRVESLKLGMSKVEVEEILGLQPYDIKEFNDTSNAYIYIYRVTDRKTLSFNTKKVNGRKELGKYVQLEVAYSKEDNKVVNIQSCNHCDDNLVTKKQVDFEKIIIFLTVTLPVILVYIGLK